LISPIIIFGCDRSGTTFIGDILGSSSKSFTTPESHFFHDLYRLHYLDRLKDENVFYDFVKENGRIQTWNLNREELIKSYAVDYCRNYDIRSLINSILELYINSFVKKDVIYWIDHTPDNINMVENWIDLFPSCKFIHIVRDGRAVYHSLRKLPWGPTSSHFCSIYWSQKVWKSLQITNRFKDRSITVRYEDIVVNPNKKIKEICDFCNLDFTPNIINGGGLLLPSFTRKQHFYVGKGVSREPLDKWKKELNYRQISVFENSSYSRDILLHFNYNTLTNEEKLCWYNLIPSLIIECNSFIRSKYYFSRLNKGNL
jgi:hypothetical protein